MLKHLSQDLDELKSELGSSLIPADHIRCPEGCPTGFTPLDRFLLWRGFPKGALSLLRGPGGLGATHLWIQAARAVTQNRRWAAWIDHPQTQINPWRLRHQNVALDRLLYVGPPKDFRQTLWALQELCSLNLFDLIGCSLCDGRLSSSQILKMKRLALRYQVAMVFFSPTQKTHSAFSLVLNFQKETVSVERALHRPTPHILERRNFYADTVPLLATGRSALCG